MQVAVAVLLTLVRQALGARAVEVLVVRAVQVLAEQPTLVAVAGADITAQQVVQAALAL
jgi:hypothetical protein